MEPGYAATLVMLPDMEQEYVIQWGAGLGSVDPGFTLADGWNLTGFESSVSSGTAELVTSLGGLAGAVVSAFLQQSTFDGAGLYRLEFDAGYWRLGPKVLALE